MPVSFSAKKALRRDQRRRQINLKIKEKYKLALKKARKSRTKKTLKEAYSLLDQAAKKRVIHKRKAARLKSRLAKFFKKPKPRLKVRKKKATTQKKTS